MGIDDDETVESKHIMSYFIWNNVWTLREKVKNIIFCFFFIRFKACLLQQLLHLFLGLPGNFCQLVPDNLLYQSIICHSSYVLLPFLISSNYIALYFFQIALISTFLGYEYSLLQLPTIIYSTDRINSLFMSI